MKENVMKADKRRTTPCLRPKVQSSSKGMEPKNKPMKSAEEQILERVGNNGIIHANDDYLLRIGNHTSIEEHKKTLESWELFKSIDIAAIIKQHNERLIDQGRQDAAKVFEQVDLKPIADDARRSAEAAEKNGAKLDELSKWQKDWRKNGPKIDANHPPRTTDASMVREKIMKLWNEYKKNPEPITRKRGQQPSYEEFIQYEGDTIVHEGKTLFDLLQIAKKPSENALHKTLARLLNSTSRNKKRHS